MVIARAPPWPGRISTNSQSDINQSLSSWKASIPIPVLTKTSGDSARTFAKYTRIHHAQSGASQLCHRGAIFVSPWKVLNIDHTRPITYMPY